MLVNSIPCIQTKGGDNEIQIIWRSSIKKGYSLEVFNALGDTIAVITVEESAIESLTANEVFSVRELALT